MRPGQPTLGLRAERVVGVRVEGSVIPLHKQETFTGPQKTPKCVCGGKTCISSRINLPVSDISSAMAGSMETGDGISSGLGISIMCAGGQGSRSQRGPGVSKNTTERLSGLGGPGGPRRKEETRRVRRGMFKHARPQGTKPGLKCMSLT